LRHKREDQPQSKDPYKLKLVSGGSKHPNPEHTEGDAFRSQQLGFFANVRFAACPNLSIAHTTIQRGPVPRAICEEPALSVVQGAGTMLPTLRDLGFKLLGKARAVILITDLGSVRSTILPYRLFYQRIITKER